MEKEVITQKQGVSMIIMFIIGSTMVIGVGQMQKMMFGFLLLLQ